jgi:phospholipase B1
MNNSANDIFNAAQSGAHSADLNHELDYLLQTVTQYTQTNQSDWKLLNVFIGSNDLCAICEGGYRSPTEYGQNILAALERVRASLSNVFVNLSKINQANSLIMIIYFPYT